jgi:uncharacterized protein (TIGR00255 family)
MQSMTGYGRGSAPLQSATIPSLLAVDIRSVNHRFFELRLHVDPQLSALGSVIEEVVRRHVSRGRVDVTLRWDGQAPTRVQLDTGRARAAFEALQQLRAELSPSEHFPLALLGSVPGLFRETGGPQESELTQACRTATEAACRELMGMRRAEGELLGRDLAARCAQIGRALDELTPALPELVRLQQEKLRGRITQLLAGTGLSLEPGRLEHEIAVLADRADISEELTRLDAHARALAPLLAAGSDEPVGHRIDFLLQEMTREANTSAAKLPDAASTQVMLGIKAELLRMREQVQNVL